MAKKPEGMNYSIEHLKLGHYKDHGLSSVDAIKDDNVKEIMKEIFSHKKYVISMNDEYSYVTDHLGNYIIFKPDHVIHNKENDTYSILFSPYDQHTMNGIVLQLDDILYSNYDANLFILDDYVDKYESLKTAVKDDVALFMDRLNDKRDKVIDSLADIYFKSVDDEESKTKFKNSLKLQFLSKQLGLTSDDLESIILPLLKKSEEEHEKSSNESSYHIRDYSDIFSYDSMKDDKTRNFVEEIMSHKSYYIVNPTLNGFYKEGISNKLAKWKPNSYKTINGRTTITFHSDTTYVTLDVDEIPLRLFKVKD